MKQSTANNPAVSTNSVPPIRILKISTCPSLSGQSTLTYHIGCNAQSGILFRITLNPAVNPHQ